MFAWVGDAAIMLRQHQDMAGPALGATAFVQGLAVVGGFVPLTPLLAGVSGAVGGTGFVLRLFAWCALGAFAGSWLSFEAGGLARRREMVLHGRLVQRLEDLVERLFLRHGLLAITVGRFVAGASCLTPFAAGWSGMERRRFLLGDLIASVAWVAAVILVGRFAGEVLARLA